MQKNGLTKAIGVISHSTSLLIIAIIGGSTTGIVSPMAGSTLGSFIDPTIMLLVFLLLFEVPLKGVFKGVTNIRFISIAWTVNFLVIPCIGFAVASFFMSGDALFYTGLVIYFMAPCTDWYLGFTRLAKGNVELGAALLPINMVTQLVLFPVYLLVFDTVVGNMVDLTLLVDWFLQPLLAAALLRFVFQRYMTLLLPLCKFSIPVVLSVLVSKIFASNINQLMMHLSVVPLLLGAIFTFFIITYILGEVTASVARFDYPEHCLLTFTTGARNAPLMLGLATVALPD